MHQMVQIIRSLLYIFENHVSFKQLVIAVNVYGAVVPRLKELTKALKMEIVDVFEPKNGF